MSRNLTVHYEGRSCYDILIRDSFDDLGEKLIGLGYRENQKVCIVTDTTVSAYYLETVAHILKTHFRVVCSFVFPAGEASKHLNTVYDLYQKLIDEKFDRKSLLVALGGGVVGDLCGFAAASFLRGIDFIQIPTTLLSQVDSSVGGKTGVDFRQYKNMVGAFYMPRLVYTNVSTLNTLTDELFACGMGEVIKHGLIKDAAYYHWLKDNYEKIQARDPAALEYMVAVSCDIKRRVVEADPTEKGERALLNFGHTIGHAVEKLSDFQLLHGPCVAIGIVAASYLSMKLGYISEDVLTDICMVLRKFYLPVNTEGLTFRTDEILDTTKLDKKMESGKIKFILISETGHAFIDQNITDEQLLDAISYINISGNEK